MNKEVLKRSPKGLRIQIIISGIAGFLLGLFSSFAIGFLLGWAPNEGLYTKLAVWAVLVIGWAVASTKLWLDWKVKKYEITEDAFIVHGKAGGFGASQAIYRYESIISMRMTQGYWGKKYNYGDVRLTIPKLDKDLVMNDIEDPIQQLQQVQQRITAKSDSHQGSNLIT